MKFDPKIHHRRSIRLQGYDYSQAGAYFVTIVAWQREMLFGEIMDEETPKEGAVVLNDFGKIVLNAWIDLPNHYRHTELGAFVIMPNHVHGIILLNDNRRGGSPMSGGTILPDGTNVGKTELPTNQTRPYNPIKPRHGLPEIVRAFKSFSARRINTLRRTEGIPVWQRSYYERIIRNEPEMDGVSRYIEANPTQWTDDDENPSHIPK